MDTVTYLGHATILLQLDGVAVLTDPILRPHVGPLRRHGPPPDPRAMPEPDVVLISHLHRDHLDLPSLRRLPAETPAVVPRGAARLVSRSGATEVIELSPGERLSLSGLEVTATEAVHDGHRDRWGTEIEPLGYVISGGEWSAYFAGDTDLFEGMAELGPLDLALLPVAGWGRTLGPGHLDPDGAARALELLRPRLAVPIHWGTLYPLGMRRRIGDRLSKPPLEFAQRAAELTPEIEVRVLQPGEQMPLRAAEGLPVSDRESRR